MPGSVMKKILAGLLLVPGLLGAEQEIFNSQDPAEAPPSPAEAAAMITLPEGFRLTLFAGEPDIHQPIAMTFDDRGRLWVAESYTYEKGGQWDLRMKDRILIFEDTDQDGRFDRRKVFTSGLERLTGLEVGYGGVWVTTAPTFCFIPDRNRDDRPDGPPQALIDGFGLNAGHNMVNGLFWGPDGWLYIRHGITDVSSIGPPGTPEDGRMLLSCGIWRYHPLNRDYEILVSGTTNPWGFDYTPGGEMFFSNNVNGHLWHVVPGSFYKRMHSQHFNPHLYAYMDMCADHLHWDDKFPRKSRVPGVHNEVGGGHSHAGLMIYQGDNWPAAYRGKAFLCNTHGRRVNMDRLARKGSGFVARHEDDFLLANNPWFRGIEMKYGPDGGVYLLDWTDNGECHDHDGVHRTSGRIYKITYGDPHRVAPGLDLQQWGNLRLVNELGRKNQWYVRKAIRILQERGALEADAVDRLKTLYLACPEPAIRLSALWILAHTRSVATADTPGKSCIDIDWMAGQLGDRDEAVVCGLVRRMVDRGLDDVTAFRHLAESTESDLVRLHLAGALQKMARGGLRAEDAWPLVEVLACQAHLGTDTNYQLLVWYGLEAYVPEMPGRSIALARQTPFPLLKRFIARRLAHGIHAHPEHLDELVKDLPEADAVPVVAGLAEALHGWGKVQAPASWEAFAAGLAAHPDEKLQANLAELNTLFGAGLPVAQLKKIVVDKKQSLAGRLNAVRSLVAAGPEHDALLFTQLGDREVHLEVIRGLAAHEHPETARMLVKFYGRFKTPARRAAMAAMVSRPEWAGVLLEAIRKGTIPRGELSAFHARQVAGFNDEGLSGLLYETWGQVRKSPAEKEAAMKKWTALLTPARLAGADLVSGEAAFQRACAACHVLFGRGGKLGPELTGTDRRNTFYLLENILDPGAVVPIDYRVMILEKKDGTVLAGSLVEQNEQVVTLQTTTERVTVPRRKIKRLERGLVSTMPEGLLQVFSEQEVVDLVAFLQQ